MAWQGDIQWRKAQQWLHSTGKLATNRHDVLIDFAMTLIDGVILCEVAHFLQPGSVKSFATRPTIQFMCVKNIDIFLNSCIKYFGFQTHELFTATELLEVENFGKVVEVLAKLSQTAQAHSKGLKPFYCHYDDHEIYTTLQREAESRSEDIYSRIEDCTHFDRTSDYTGYQDSSYQTESIYEDIVKIKQYRMDKPSDKRGYLIDEIFETEKNYVQLLETIIVNFQEKLKPILTNGDLKIVFHNIEDLKRVHEKLLQRLKLSIDNGGGTIGECFVKTEEQFYQYGPYCANLDTASSKIDELMSDSKITNLINRCSTESKQRFGIKDLLKVPAQRILKYHLLLDNLCKDSPNHSGLREGCRVMKALAQYINEYKRNYEQWLATRAIEERMQSKDLENDLYSYGKLLKDGEIMLKTNSKSVKRFAFLFEQCILICKKGEHSSLEIQHLLDFESYEVVERFDPPGGGKFSFGWSMKQRLDLLAPAYNIMVKTSDQAAVWMAKLEEGYSLLCNPSHHKTPHSFKLKDFNTYTRCSVCGELLSGIFAQGLACSVCQLACHRLCKLGMVDCKRSKNSHSKQGSRQKELPSIPLSSPSFSYTDPIVQYDGSSNTSPGPPPIPPRAPSLRNSQGRRSSSIPNTPTSQFSSRSPSFDQTAGSTSPQQFTIKGDLYVCTKDYAAGFISEIFEPTIVLSKGEFVEVTKKEHPMYWKGKSQSSGLIGYFPSDNVKIYSPRQDVTPSAVMPSTKQQLDRFLWYVGEMDRNGGRMMLDPATVPDGCYLVRESKTRVGQFSIDVKFNFMVKHIKVVCSEEDKTYCLAPSKKFSSIVELVTHYQHNTLGQVFRDLQTKLMVPYRCLPGS